jgi:hypothetical protein
MPKGYSHKLETNCRHDFESCNSNMEDKIRKHGVDLGLYQKNVAFLR